MGTIWVREFIGGLDGRRLPETTPGGAFIRAVDGHITRGGEFEQRAKFVKVYDLPPEETKGLAATNDGLYVFGAAATSAVPSGVTYQRLTPQSTETVSEVLSWTLFKGKLHVAAMMSDGVVRNWFDGTRVTDWPAGASFATFVRTVQQKVYGAAGPNLHFSAIADSTKFNSGVGYGFIDLSTQATGSEALTSIAQYQNYVAVFAARTIQLEYVDPDPNNNRLAQTLNNTGTVAPRSVTQFGDNDVFYLDESGIRSLRARESINVAFSSDTGNPIDDLIIAKLDTLTEDEKKRCIGLIEPRDGRLWVIMKDEIFVFSYFTASKVSAWTTYHPGFIVDDAVVHDRRVYLRSGDAIYVYGGVDAFAYDEVYAEAWLPYLDAGAPTHAKAFSGVDAAVRGTWEIAVGVEPNNVEAQDKVATVTETTYTHERLPMAINSTHISVRFKLKSPSGGQPAKLGAVVVHHDMNADED